MRISDWSSDVCSSDLADPPDHDIAHSAGAHPSSPHLCSRLPRTLMIALSAYREQWLGNIRGDILSGLVVALALIPEAIAFSIIAGVDPKIGLYASFSIAVVTAILGGRPGMISAATAATAVLKIGRAHV